MMIIMMKMMMHMMMMTMMTIMKMMMMTSGSGNAAMGTLFANSVGKSHRFVFICTDLLVDFHQFASIPIYIKPIPTSHPIYR